jgi:hypothetical protein
MNQYIFSSSKSFYRLPYATFEESSFGRAPFGKFFIFCFFAVFRTDGRIIAIEVVTFLETSSTATSLFKSFVLAYSYDPTLNKKCFFVYFFGGLECVGNYFADVSHL